MSEPVTALGGATFDGSATITEAARTGMITVRGDLSSGPLKRAVRDATGLAIPGQGTMAQKDVYGIAWMSPDEVLVLCPYDDVADTVAQLHTALGDTFAMAVDVSDARAMFTLSGDAASVLAKLAPVDLSDAAFPPGSFRRTRLAQVAAAVWRNADDSYQVVCFRSVAQYVFDILKNAAQPR
ncbi:MAG: sarcosine oxidase subunit gamma family protein [Pseudomonadota bacterium]